MQATGQKTCQGRQGPGARELGFRQRGVSKGRGPEMKKSSSRHVQTDCAWQGCGDGGDLVFDLSIWMGCGSID